MNMNYNAPLTSQQGQAKTKLRQQQAFYIIDASFADTDRTLLYRQLHRVGNRPAHRAVILAFFRFYRLLGSLTVCY